MSLQPIGSLEKKLLKSHQNGAIAGVDEVGRGCLAGPVYAACAILDYKQLANIPGPDRDLIRDSKTLSQKQRQKALLTIHKVALKLNVAAAQVAEIEVLGIVGATFLAMKRAIYPFTSQIGLLLVDGKFKIPDLALPQEAIVGGDNACFAIAAASILAKESRDLFMRQQDVLFPGYGFSKNVGYGTKLHQDGLKRQGLCPLHRRNFAPISQIGLEMSY